MLFVADRLAIFFIVSKEKKLNYRLFWLHVGIGFEFPLESHFHFKR